MEAICRPWPDVISTHAVFGGVMKQKYDVGAMLAAATLLLLCVSYLTQCSSTVHRPDTVVAATPAATPPAQARDEDMERERKPKSVHEFAAQEEKEEREKVQAIGHALQTAGADPAFRKTYGLPQ